MLMSIDMIVWPHPIKAQLPTRSPKQVLPCSLNLFSFQTQPFGKVDSLTEATLKRVYFEDSAEIC